MKSCYIAHEVVKAVSSDSSCAVEVYSVKALHYVGVIRYFKVGNLRLAEPFQLHVFRVVLSYRHARVDDVRDDHHYALYLFFKLRFPLFKLFKPFCGLCDFFLCLFGLFALALSHQRAYFLRKPVSVRSQAVSLCYGCSVLLVELYYLVYKREFCVLKLVFDVLLYCFGVFPQKFNVYHTCLSFPAHMFHVEHQPLMPPSRFAIAIKSSSE